MDERSPSTQEQSAEIQELLVDATIAVMEISLKLEAAGMSIPDGDETQELGSRLVRHTPGLSLRSFAEVEWGCGRGSSFRT